MTDATPKTGLALLREPFPDHQISKLPKGTKAQNECPPGDKINCKVCGGWHHPKIIHLDYVGHAALTDRLLDADPAWTWEPLSMSESGLPVMDDLGGMWIRLTVCGVTRIGYGHAGTKSGGDAIKEVIGDALRNSGMRFGVALNLWHKGDLHADEADEKPPATTGTAEKTVTAAKTPQESARLIAVGVSAGDAVGAATAMSEWDDDRYQAVWKLLDTKTANAIAAAFKTLEQPA